MRSWKIEYSAETIHISQDCMNSLWAQKVSSIEVLHRVGKDAKLLVSMKKYNSWGTYFAEGNTQITEGNYGGQDKRKKID